MFTSLAKFKSICSPALFYFVVSIVGLILIVLQNLGNTNIFSMGTFSASVPSTALMFIIQLVYILFWTWILNLICRDGYSNISWLLVLVPYILLFLFFFSMSREGLMAD